MPVSVTLVDKSGQEWVAGSAIEVNDLLAQGYRLKGHAASDPTPDRPTPGPVTNTGGVAPAADESGAK